LFERHSAEYPLQAYEGMIGDDRAALEHVIAILAFYDNGIAAIRRLAGFTEAAQELGKSGFHVNQII